MSMETISYKTLREANIAARQAEWDIGDVKLSDSFRLCELAGEVGEACNILKKIERENLGLVGSRATPAQLIDELCDIVICCDLALLGRGHPPVGNVSIGMYDKSLTEFGQTLAMLVGKICDPEQERSFQFWIGQLAANCLLIAFNSGHDLFGALKEKFNATSEARGLRTRLTGGW